jgi:hypothetical protein
MTPRVPAVTVNAPRGQITVHRTNGDDVVLHAPTDPESAERLAGRIRGALADAFHAGCHETEHLLRSHP